MHYWLCSKLHQMLKWMLYGLGVILVIGAEDALGWHSLTMSIFLHTPHGGVLPQSALPKGRQL